MEVIKSSLGLAKYCDDEAALNCLWDDVRYWRDEDDIRGFEPCLEFYPQEGCSKELFDLRYGYGVFFAWKAMWNPSIYADEFFWPSCGHDQFTSRVVT